MRTIETDKLIERFSWCSIKMQNQETFCLPVNRLYRYDGQYYETKLYAWEIPRIVYLSVINSNDYGTAELPIDWDTLVQLFKEYDCRNTVVEESDEEDGNYIYHLLLGITAEQGPYQRLQFKSVWIHERIIRDYYILVKATHFKHHGVIDVNSAISQLFGCTVDDYVALLFLVLWLCTISPSPLSIPENKYRKNDSTVFTRNNLQKLIEHYTCSYSDLRTSGLKSQLLISKPFVRTERTKICYSSSVHLVHMMIANGLYWVVRDYYSCNNIDFPGAFGSLFEDYIKDLADRYCCSDEWATIPRDAGGKRKNGIQSNIENADFFFNFGSYRLIVEAKSCLLPLNARQQSPNTESIRTFYNRAITKAYKQIQSTLSLPYYNDSIVPGSVTLKIILLYDEFSTTAVIERLYNEPFETDLHCFALTIRDFEILLYLHHHDQEKCNKVFRTVLQRVKGGKRTDNNNFAETYKKLSINRNPHFDENPDYFTELMQYVKQQYSD